MNGASPDVQLENPGEDPPSTPRIISTPAIRNTITATTLIPASQNSDSPYPRAERAFSPVSSRKAAAHTQPGTCGNQKAITMPAATSSAATVIAQLNQ